jgi:hypothetical protein
MARASAAQNETPLAPVQTARAAPPAALADRMAQAEGRGVSQDQADNLVPLVYVLQPGSPQVKPDEPQFIEGATAGMIWLRGAPAELQLQKELLFQPCHFSKDFVEWKPRDMGGGGGAGYVGRHGFATHPTDRARIAPDITGPDGKPDWEEVADPQDRTRTKFVRKSTKNDLVETRYHAGWVLGLGSPMPYIMPLSGTGHSFSRDWMQRQNTALARPDGRSLDSWWKVWKLTTVYRKNAKGSWYMLSPVEATDRDGYPGGWVQAAEDLDRGEALFRSLSSGEMRAEEPLGDHSTAEGSAAQHI